MLNRYGHHSNGFVRRSAWWLLLMLWTLACGYAVDVAPALGCGIDGIPSMAMNGRLVTINHAQATKDTLAFYAPFLLGTARAGADLHFAEDAAKLHKALTDQAFATPFQWTFGDGAVARGLAVQHRYRLPGMYKVNVSYYYTPQRRWVVFDSAQLRIPGAPASTPAHGPSPLLLGAIGASFGLCALAAAWLLLSRCTASPLEPRGRVTGRGARGRSR